MGGKSDLANREDRPESGGTDRNNIRSNSGLQERDKQAFAQDMAEKRASEPENPHDQTHAPFTIGNEPNNAKVAGNAEETE
jgi:hypothetical protein